MHAAILAVNEALGKDNSAELYAALSNPNTCIKQLMEENEARYQILLFQAKTAKATAAMLLVCACMCMYVSPGRVVRICI